MSNRHRVVVESHISDSVTMWNRHKVLVESHISDWKGKLFHLDWQCSWPDFFFFSFLLSFSQSLRSQAMELQWYSCQIFSHQDTDIENALKTIKDKDISVSNESWSCFYHICNFRIRCLWLRFLWHSTHLYQTPAGTWGMGGGCQLVDLCQTKEHQTKICRLLWLWLVLDN